MYNQKLFGTAKSQIVCQIACTESFDFTYSRSFHFCRLKSKEAITMDQSVTVTKKKAEDNSQENPSSDSSSSQPTTSQPKHKPVNRKFNLQWENDFFVTESNKKTICLVCRIEFSDNKKYSIERHFTSQHGDKHTKFLDPTKRAIEIDRLKNELQGEKTVVRKFLDKNEILTCASYQIAFNIAKSAKPYTDGEFHKSLLQTTFSIL